MFLALIEWTNSLMDTCNRDDEWLDAWSSFHNIQDEENR